MARRSAHTPEELRQRILEAAQTIIERDGLVGLSAREIARLIDYSPGTLYNIFENLDDVLLTLQTQMVASLVDVLKGVALGPSPADQHRRLSAHLSRFRARQQAHVEPVVHALPAARRSGPPALHDNVNMISALVADVIQPLMPNASKTEVEIAAKTFWASVHGITAIAVTDKGPTLNSATAHVLREAADHHLYARSRRPCSGAN